MMQGWFLLMPKILIWDEARSLFLPRKQIIWLIVILVVISLDLVIPSLLVLYGFANQSGLGLHQTEFGFNLKLWHPRKKPEQTYHSPHSCSCFEKGCWKKVQKCTRQPPTVHIVGSFQVVFPWPQDFREICKITQTVRANHSEFDEFTQLFDYLNSLITTRRLPFWDSACTLNFLLFFSTIFLKTAVRCLHKSAV